MKTPHSHLIKTAVLLAGFSMMAFTEVGLCRGSSGLSASAEVTQAADRWVLLITITNASKRTFNLEMESLPSHYDRCVSLSLVMFDRRDLPFRPWYPEARPPVGTEELQPGKQIVSRLMLDRLFRAEDIQHLKKPFALFWAFSLKDVKASESYRFAGAVKVEP